MNSITLSPLEFIYVCGFKKITFSPFICSIVYDDIDLEPGTIRIRKKGSPGTHNGMKSVVHFLQTEDFVRVRVGIGKPKYSNDLINYVIGAIDEEDKKILEQGVNRAADAVLEILKNGIDVAMNKYNSK